MPSDLVVNPETGALFPLDTLLKNFEEAGVNLIKPIATTCRWRFDNSWPNDGGTVVEGMGKLRG